MIVIGFVGSAYAGKTTTIMESKKELEKLGFSVDIVGESFRDVMQRYGENLDKIREDVELYKKVEMEAINTHIDKVYKKLKKDKVDVVLVDRMILDYFLYCIEYLPFAKWSEVVGKYLDAAEVELAMFDKIFLCEPLKGEEWDDGFRSRNDYERRLRHFEMYKTWLKGENFEVLSGNIEERVGRVVNCVLELLEQKRF